MRANYTNIFIIKLKHEKKNYQLITNLEDMCQMKERHDDGA